MSEVNTGILLQQIILLKLHEDLYHPYHSHGKLIRSNGRAKALLKDLLPLLHPPLLLYNATRWRRRYRLLPLDVFSSNDL